MDVCEWDFLMFTLIYGIQCATAAGNGKLKQNQKNILFSDPIVLCRVVLAVIALVSLKIARVNYVTQTCQSWTSLGANVRSRSSKKVLPFILPNTFPFLTLLSTFIILHTKTFWGKKQLIQKRVFSSIFLKFLWRKLANRILS